MKACFVYGFDNHAARCLTSLRYHNPYLRVGTQDGYAGLCLVVGKGGMADLLSA
jgi:hypothetical protein